ncbi:Chromate resistance protein ChrB [Zongyangia hominis]|uniref:ChrB N-terminal domain-containing protein n=1 Tax=Zongyangia hominis TaxID=2763677 RepID=A0A926E9B3_9FIRM|nr:Chromate resistance protein ChrB [Zongyangia hominis]MBC8570290.1 hypothetical protein [Zongyangia hominis]
MPERVKWIGLGYNLPVNPSKNRVYVWRKLKEMGADYFKQSMAILPKNPVNVRAMVRLQDKIRDLGGEATLIEMQFVDERDEMRMIARFKEARRKEYDDIITETHRLLGTLQQNGRTKMAPETGDELKKLIKRYERVRARDFFGLGTGGVLEGDIRQIAELLRSSMDGFSAQLRRMLDAWIH